MMNVMNCAICQNLKILDFKQKFEDAVCSRCGKPFRYRLISTSICEIDLMDLALDEAETYDGTGL